MSKLNLDITDQITLFCQQLRRNGLKIGPSEVSDVLKAISITDLSYPNSVYWTMRTILVSSCTEIDIFNSLFNEFFKTTSDQVHQNNKNSDLAGSARQFNNSKSIISEAIHDESSKNKLVGIVRTGASSESYRGKSNVSLLSKVELDEVSKIAELIVANILKRNGRRFEQNPRKGYFDLRSVFRKNLATGGELLILPHKKRLKKKAKIILIIDVSGSMNKHSELMLALAYFITQKTSRIETFVFSTTATRISDWLQSKTYTDMVNQVRQQVNNWSAGTKIGESLSEIANQYRSLLNKQSTVFIISDGWDTGDPKFLAKILNNKINKVKTIYWLNPLLGTEGYEQATRSLIAATPFINRFFSIRDMSELKKMPGLLRM